MRWSRVAAAGVIALWPVSLALAQAGSASPERAASTGSIDVAVGLAWAGGSALGSRTATLTPNQAGAPPYAWFTVAADAAASRGFDVRLGYRLTSALSLEAGAAGTRGDVIAHLSGDAEDAPDSSFAGERITQVQVEAHLLVRLRRLAFAGGRALPHVEFGGGIVRQWHEGDQVTERGHVFDLGGGVDYVLGTRSRGFGRRIGVRLDVLARRMSGGFHLGRERRTYPAGNAGLFVTF